MGMTLARLLIITGVAILAGGLVALAAASAGAAVAATGVCLIAGGLFGVDVDGEA